MNTPQNIPTPNLQGISDPVTQQVLLDLCRTIKDSFNKVYLDIKAINNLPVYASNALAIAGGLAVGRFYRNGDNICQVHT